MNLLKQRRVEEAVHACQAFLRSNPESNDALLLLGKARQMQGRFDEMLRLVESALKRDPGNVDLQLQYAGACQFCGHHDRALAQLSKLERKARANAGLLRKVAKLYLDACAPRRAHRCFLRAASLEPHDPETLYGLASSYVFVGDLRRAEQTYSRVISLVPDHYFAWYNRSTLKNARG